MRYNRFVISGIIAAAVMLTMLVVGAAGAADIPRKAPLASDGAVVPNKWDSKYIGVLFGVEQGKSNTSVDGWTNKSPVQKCYTKEQEVGPAIEKCYDVHHQYVSTTYPGVSSNNNVIGPTLGAYLGINKPLNGALVGSVEVDASYSGARDNEVIYAVTSAHRTPFNARARVRIGVLPTPNSDIMPFVAAGAILKSRRSEINGPTGAASASSTDFGWTAGAGVDIKWNVLTARIEGGWDQVRDQTVSIPGASSTLKGGSLFGRVGLGVSF